MYDKVVASWCALSSLHSVEEIDVQRESNLEPGGNNTHSRILTVFSYVLLMLYRRSNSFAAAKASPPGKPLPSLASLASMVSRKAGGGLDFVCAALSFPTHEQNQVARRFGMYLFSWNILL